MLRRAGPGQLSWLGLGCGMELGGVMLSCELCAGMGISNETVLLPLACPYLLVTTLHTNSYANKHYRQSLQKSETTVLPRIGFEFSCKRSLA